MTFDQAKRCFLSISRTQVKKLVLFKSPVRGMLFCNKLFQKTKQLRSPQNLFPSCPGTICCIFSPAKTGQKLAAEGSVGLFEAPLNCTKPWRKDLSKCCFASKRCLLELSLPKKLSALSSSSMCPFIRNWIVFCFAKESERKWRATYQPTTILNLSIIDARILWGCWARQTPHGSPHTCVGSPCKCWPLDFFKYSSCFISDSGWMKDASQQTTKPCQFSCWDRSILH